MTKEDFNELINGDNPTLVKFYAEWCAPCKALSPIVSNIATTYNTKINSVSIDIEESMDIARMYNVRQIPTLILFDGGEPIRISDKTHDGIVSVIDNALEDFSDVEL